MPTYNIFGVTRNELCQWLATEHTGNAEARARHIFREVYKRDVRFAKDLREVQSLVLRSLQNQFDFSLPLDLESFHRSERDGSIKMVFRLKKDGLKIESVLIPERGHLTQCLSTQVGCAQGCRFCSTGRMGLLRQLEVSEIVGQWVFANRWRKESADAAHLAAYDTIRNVVFMGMGEPLDNLEALVSAIEIFTDSQGIFLSPNRVTVSTVGLLPQLEQLLKRTGASVALSLHSPFDDERSRLMPVNVTHPIAKVVELLRLQEAPRAPWKKRTFFIQYTLIRNVNDSLEHAQALAELLREVAVKINLIPLNEHEGTAMRRPDLGKVYDFQQCLKSLGIVTTVRVSKGRDIAAACGQLIKKERAVHDTRSL